MKFNDRPKLGHTFKIGEENCLVDLRLEKFSMPAMVDSGAAISCLTYSVYKRSGLQRDYQIQNSDTKNA